MVRGADRAGVPHITDDISILVMTHNPMILRILYPFLFNVDETDFYPNTFYYT